MTTFLADAGYWALIAFAVLQACCIPISSELTFGFAGVLAYQGHLSLALVIIIGTVGELAGSSAGYGLGRLGGRGIVERFRKYLLMTRRDVERAERFFAGRGSWAVALGRILPLVRAFTGLAAGFMEVPFLPFEAFNVLGTLAYVLPLSALGYEFGSDWDKVSKNFSHASDALVVLILLVLAALIAHKARELRKERRADEAAGAAAVVPGVASAAGQPGRRDDTRSAAGTSVPGRPHSHRRTRGS